MLEKLTRPPRRSVQPSRSHNVIKLRRSITLTCRARRRG